MRNTNISKRVGAPRTHWLPPRRDGEIQELEATAAPLPFSPGLPSRPGLSRAVRLARTLASRAGAGSRCCPGGRTATRGAGSHCRYQRRLAAGRIASPRGAGRAGDGSGPCLASERRAGWVGGRGKFMVCVHFLAPEPGAPERWGPPRPKPRPGAAGAAATGGPRVPALCCAQAGKCPAGAAENESRGAQGTSLGDPRVCTRGLESRAPGAWRGIPGPA